MGHMKKQRLRGVKKSSGTAKGWDEFPALRSPLPQLHRKVLKYYIIILPTLKVVRVLT